MKEILPSPFINTKSGWKQNVIPGYESEVSSLQSFNKRKILENFFTNVDGRVTAITGAMPPVLSAALTARFSRAQESDVTELFWNEFVNNKDLGVDLSKNKNRENDGVLLGDHARKVIRRILDEYGDDSVREQASGYLMIKGSSILTSMQAFRHPLITGIEASTRYIDWSRLPLEDFCVKPEGISKDSEAYKIYLEAINFSRNTYAELWQPVWDRVARKNPNTDPSKAVAYKISVKGAVCDELRGLLPLGVKTNFGIHADFRTLSEEIMNLRASGLPETISIANEMAVELSKVNPEFISVVDSEHGVKWTENQVNVVNILQNLSGVVEFEDNNNLSIGTEILNRNWLLDIAREAILSKNGGLKDIQVHKQALEFARNGNLEKLFSDLREARKNRRHKLPDVFNSVAVRVSIKNLSFGAYKDLNRHRNLLSKSDPDYSGGRGFVVPDLIEEIGGEIKEKYVAAQMKLLHAKSKLESKYFEESKLLLSHGNKTSFEMVMGLGELYWISELRSIPSGNAEYRKIAIEMHKSILEKAPTLSILGSFVDPKDYSLGRITEATRADLKGK